MTRHFVRFDLRILFICNQLPAGIQPGETRVLRGLGFPVLGGKPGERGDLFLKFNIRIPAIGNDAGLKLALEAIGAHLFP